MKVAVCFSGLVRTYRETYQNYLDCFISPNKHHSIDTFISTWAVEHSNASMEWTRRQAWYGDRAKPFPEELIDFPDLYQKYDPTSIEIERHKQVDASWASPGFNLESFMLMLYKIYMADRLRRKHEEITSTQYDAVVRIRFDTVLPHPIVLDELNLDVLSVPSMAQPKIYDHDWVNDKFAVGKPALLSHYCEWFLNVRRLVEQGCPLQPESTLCAHLMEGGVTWNPWGSEMQMIRLSGY